MSSLKTIFLYATIIFVGCNEQANKKSGIGEITPADIKLTNLKNEPVDLATLKGKTVFINFWATWCKPCIREMPSIQKAMEILKGKNIEFLFASEESKEQIENFKSSNEYDFNYVRLENPGLLNIMALPTTYIFNPGGKLVFSEMGVRQWDDKSNIELIMNTIK